MKFIVHAFQKFNSKPCDRETLPYKFWAKRTSPAAFNVRSTVFCHLKAVFCLKYEISGLLNHYKSLASFLINLSSLEGSDLENHLSEALGPFCAKVIKANDFVALRNSGQLAFYLSRSTQVCLRRFTTTLKKYNFYIIVCSNSKELLK